MDEIVCYLYCAYYSEKTRVLEISKRPCVAYKIEDNGYGEVNKYQLKGFSDNYSFYDDDPTNFIMDFEDSDLSLMIDYITLDPNAEKKFTEKVIKTLMKRAIKERENK